MAARDVLQRRARLGRLTAAAASLCTAACMEGIGVLDDSLIEGVDTVIVTERVDFSAGGTRPVEPPPDPVRVGSFLLQASVVPQDTSTSTPPMSLLFVVTAENPADTSATLAVDGCTVRPRMYESPARDGDPLWAPQGVCTQEPYSLTIAPGAAEELSFLAYDLMLGDALPDGRYYASVELRMAEGPAVLEAGHADVRLEEPGLSFHVVVGEAGDGAGASVVVTNLNPTSTYLQFGACSLGLSLYRGPDRTEPVTAWIRDRICLDYLRIASLAPGDSLAADEFSSEFNLGELSRVGIRPGSYHLTARLELNSRAYTFPAGFIHLW